MADSDDDAEIEVVGVAKAPPAAAAAETIDLCGEDAPMNQKMANRKRKAAATWNGTADAIDLVHMDPQQHPSSESPQCCWQNEQDDDDDDDTDNFARGYTAVSVSGTVNGGTFCFGLDPRVHVR